MKKIGILGTDGSVKKAYMMDTPAFLNSVGANTGNLFFQYAVYNEISEESYVVGKQLPWDPKIVNEKCRILVIPSANFLRENFDLTGYVNFLDKCDLPLLFLGLGAQADNFEKKSFEFHPSILKLIDLIKHKSSCVGVRGVYSAEILSSFGVDNISIIGCPTNFINKDEHLSEKLEAKWKKESFAITTTGDEPWPKSPLKKKAEQKLFEMAFENRGLYVQQSVEPLVKAIRSSNLYANPMDDISLSVENLRLALAPQIEVKPFRNFLISSVRLYINIDQWMEDVSRFDLSIGLRLHGNMVSFQSGCPSIWIYHDARTKELIDTMSLPHLSLDAFLQCNNVDEMKEKVNPDFNKYKLTRTCLLDNYKRLFEKNNIKIYS
jgi:hypothetical protein